MNREKFRLKSSPHWIQIFKWYIEHKNGTTLQLLSEKYNKSRKFFIHHFRWYSLPIITHRNKWRIVIKETKKNHEFFEVIDSELKAYLLGLMASDGHIPLKEDRIVFSSKDREQCELFKTHIAPELKLIKGTNYSYVFCCSSKPLVNSLKRYGITPQKSWKELSIPDIPKYLIRHFIRGFFDGDGWCCITKCKIYNSHGCIWGICTRSFTLINEISNVLQEHNIHSSFEKRTDGLYKLYVRRRESLNVLHQYLYSNSHYFLDRKFDKLNFFVSTPSKLTKLKRRELCNA